MSSPINTCNVIGMLMMTNMMMLEMMKMSMMIMMKIKIMMMTFSSRVLSQQEIIIPADLPLVQELGATLREWAQIWHKLFVVGCGFHPIRCSVH